jgi:hypothetical protein
MASLFDWSSTASSNTTCDGIGTNTGMSPANVDNVFRSIMALVRNSFASALQSFLAGSAPLPIANGGTAATTASTALASLGGLSSSYRDLVRTDKAAGWTFADSERGYGIAYIPSPLSTPATATINPEGTTAITYGAVYVIANYATAALTITAGSGVTLKVNGGAAASSAVIAANGIATLIKWGTDNWTITGPGVS